MAMSTKELAHAAIDTLPDDATLQDAAEKLALLAALEKSRQSVTTGHWKTQADVEKLLPQWLEK
jgi:DNA mismatch repair ATPase MutL